MTGHAGKNEFGDFDFVQVARIRSIRLEICFPSFSNGLHNVLSSSAFSSLARVARPIGRAPCFLSRVYFEDLQSTDPLEKCLQSVGLRDWMSRGHRS